MGVVSPARCHPASADRANGCGWQPSYGSRLLLLSVSGRRRRAFTVWLSNAFPVPVTGPRTSSALANRALNKQVTVCVLGV